jgi:hypothetical protein
MIYDHFFSTSNSEKKISVVALLHYSITAASQPKKGNMVLLTHPNLSHT